MRNAFKKKIPAKVDEAFKLFVDVCFLLAMQKYFIALCNDKLILHPHNKYFLLHI